MDKSVRRTRKGRKDDCSVPTPQTQSLATSLIIFIFIVYGCGFLSTVMSLPPLNPREVFAFYKTGYQGSDGNSVSKQKGVGLNIAKKGFVRDQDDEEENDNQVDGTDTEEEKEEEAVEEPVEDSKENEFVAKNVVPASKWPVSAIKGKEGWFEMSHPGDEDIKIDVPPFWSSPVHNNTLMSRSLAMSIGTCAKPDPQTGSFQIGERCPMEERTIFVAIASYRDWQCRYTVESIFNRAKYPHRIRVGIVDQIVLGDDICDHPIEACEDKPDQALCKYIDQVDNFVMDAPLSVGPVFARHIGHRLYRGEYYTMQSDAHVTFTQGTFGTQQMTFMLSLSNL